MKPLFLDDLHIGQRFVSDEYELTDLEITWFARHFDPQPFHLDAEKAEHTFFRGLAASGWHTAAITMLLLTSSIPLEAGIIGAGGEIAWPRPTRPGDVLHVESQVLEIRPSGTKPDRAIVKFLCETKTRDGEVVQRLHPNLIVFRKHKEQTADL